MEKREKATLFAPALEFYRSLSQSKKEVLKPALTRAFWLHLQVLERLEEGDTYWGIAEALSVNPNTIKQISYGFEDAGILFQVSQEKATYRPRIKKRRKK